LRKRMERGVSCGLKEEKVNVYIKRDIITEKARANKEESSIRGQCPAKTSSGREKFWE